MASLCQWIFLLSEFYFSQATLEQLAHTADKALPCIAGPDVLIQGSVLTPAVSAQHRPGSPRASPGAWPRYSCGAAKSGAFLPPCSLGLGLPAAFSHRHPLESVLLSEVPALVLSHKHSQECQWRKTGLKKSVHSQDSLLMTHDRPSSCLTPGITVGLPCAGPAVCAL